MSTYDKLITDVLDVFIATQKRKTEAAWDKATHDFNSMVRGALINLDAVDPALGDRLVDSMRDVLNKIAKERALGNEGVTA